MKYFVRYTVDHLDIFKSPTSIDKKHMLSADTWTTGKVAFND